MEGDILKESIKRFVLPFMADDTKISYLEDMMRANAEAMQRLNQVQNSPRAFKFDLTGRIGMHQDMAQWAAEQAMQLRKNKLASIPVAQQ